MEYSIVGGDPLNQFGIELDTGVITTRKLLDRENLAEYNLVVMATDLAERPLYSFLNVTVLVRDVNDNVPILIMPESL